MDDGKAASMAYGDSERGETMTDNERARAMIQAHAKAMQGDAQHMAIWEGYFNYFYDKGASPDDIVRLAKGDA